MPLTTYTNFVMETPVCREGGSCITCNAIWARQAFARQTAAYETLSNTASNATATFDRLRSAFEQPQYEDEPEPDPYYPEPSETVEENAQARTDCRCEACKLARREVSKIKRVTVHQYSYKPRNWRLHAGRGESLTNAYYFGVELETDIYRAGRYQNGIENGHAADMRRPKRFWVAKRDGSVSGPEFASHPATMKWWNDHREDMAEMFRMLVHAGYRSHDGGNAGMHINISRNAFGDTEHLYRFITLLHSDTDWALKLSQRSESTMRQWASLEVMGDERRRRALVEGALDPYGSRAYCPRYSALNMPSGEPRFEFRLPRGTLRPERFYKNLEWTHSMIEFARGETLVNCNADKYNKWVSAKRATYPNLFEFLTTKMGVTA